MATLRLKTIVIVCVIVVLIFNLRKTAPIRFIVVSSRRARLRNLHIPDEWSWQSVSVSDSKLWKECFGNSIAPGSYTSPVFDQHFSRWCGCCYLVSAVQMLQDRMHVALGINDPMNPMFPCFYFNMQLALDTYNHHEQVRSADWNACKGGMPLRVLQAIGDDTCKLRLIRDGEVWFGHPSSIDESIPSDDPPIYIEEPEVLQNRVEYIKRRIFKYGPVVLGINSKCFLDEGIIARGGLINTKHNALPDHALTVVGWKKIGDTTCWIARNSWGMETVPTNRPDDASCVGNDFNNCETGKNKWVGDMHNPGYAYIPTDYQSIHGLPSPWFDAIPVSLRKRQARDAYDIKDDF